MYSTYKFCRWKKASFLFLQVQYNNILFFVVIRIQISLQGRKNHVWFQQCWTHWCWRCQQTIEGRMSRSTFAGKHDYSQLFYIVHTTGCSTDKVWNLLVNGKNNEFWFKTHSINNFQQIPCLLIFYNLNFLLHNDHRITSLIWSLEITVPS